MAKPFGFPSIIFTLNSAILFSKSKQFIINALSATIVHELLHINRAIIINGKTSSYDLKYLNDLGNDSKIESVISPNFDKNIDLYNKLLKDVKRSASIINKRLLTK